MEVSGEPYRRLSQPPVRIYHGLRGAHRVEEPLYRHVGADNGPTLKPLDLRLGVAEDSMLPNLARVAGALMATMTSRQTEQTLQRLGLHQPSRAVLERRVVGMLTDMAVGERELEEHCRRTEQLDFDMAGWYRLKLLTDRRGASHIVEHLRRELDEHHDADVHAATKAALTYFEKRRPQMAYAKARAANQPIASGATESTCTLFQLRVKHPGSHWGPPGLRGAMTARGLELSDRWDAAFDAHRTTLRAEVQAT